MLGFHASSVNLSNLDHPNKPATQYGQWGAYLSNRAIRAITYYGYSYCTHSLDIHIVLTLWISLGFDYRAMVLCSNGFTSWALGYTDLHLAAAVQKQDRANSRWTAQWGLSGRVPRLWPGAPG